MCWCSLAFTDKLEKQPKKRSALKLFFGFLAGYIIAITGHQKGVIINMTTEEVRTAENAIDGVHIICISKYGHAKYIHVQLVCKKVK